jgi:hypothetical protein
VRDQAVLAEVLSWLPPHYQRELRGIVHENARQGKEWWR